MINFDYKGLTGDIVTRDDFEYEECRKAWNRAIEKYPLVIVYCYTEVDIKNAINFAKVNKLNVVKKIYNDGDLKYLTKIAEKITLDDNMVVLFAIKFEDKVNLIFACSKNIKGLSMNVLLKDAITLIDGRGGGSNFLAQGGGKNSSNLDGAMDYALRKINTL